MNPEPNIIEYRKWLDENVILTDLFSVDSTKCLVLNMLQGKNYRILTEVATKEKLFKAYSWLVKLYLHSKNTYGMEWRRKLFEDAITIRNKDEKNLVLWLLGLTCKTAKNIGVDPEDYPEYLETMMANSDRFLNVLTNDEQDMVWLLLIAGAATLNIRGSQKSTIGKRLEGVLIRTMLILLGFQENKNFWMNVERDNEVGREVDVEIASNRGRIRIDVGLIESGNQEVIEDKVSRVGRNGIVIYDRVGKRSQIYGSAIAHGVKLIQIRGNDPLAILHDYLKPLVGVQLNDVPTEKELKAKLDALPDSHYACDG